MAISPAKLSMNLLVILWILWQSGSGGYEMFKEKWMMCPYNEVMGPYNEVMGPYLTIPTFIPLPLSPTSWICYPENKANANMLVNTTIKLVYYHAKAREKDILT